MATEQTNAPAPAPAAPAPAPAAPAPAAPAPAPAPAAPAPAPVAANPEDYGDAFAEFAASAAPAPAAPAPAPAAPAPAPAPAQAADTPPPAPAAPAPAPAAPVPAPAPAPSAEVAALQQQIAELTAKVAAPPPAPAPAPAAEVPLYTAEEQAVIDNHKKEWSEVAQGEALLRRGEYRELVSYIFGQIGPRLEALATSHQSVSTRTQYSAIKELVADYDEVRDATLAWVETQPAYLKKAYQEVAESGAPEDVADLITRFKTTTGWKSKTAAPAPAAPAPAPAAPAPAPAPAVAALSAEAQAAVASLKPVTSGRSAQPSPADPNDFDGAFKEFTATP